MSIGHCEVCELRADEELRPPPRGIVGSIGVVKDFMVGKSSGCCLQSLVSSAFGLQAPVVAVGHSLATSSIVGRCTLLMAKGSLNSCGRHIAGLFMFALLVCSGASCLGVFYRSAAP